MGENEGRGVETGVNTEEKMLKYSVAIYLFISVVLCSQSIFSLDEEKSSLSTKAIDQMTVSIHWDDQKEINCYSITLNGDEFSSKELLRLAEEEINTLEIACVLYFYCEKRVSADRGPEKTAKDLGLMCKRYGILFDDWRPVSKIIEEEETLQANGIYLTMAESRGSKEEKRKYHLSFRYVEEKLTGEMHPLTPEVAFDIVCRHIERENIGRLVVTSKNSESKKAFVQKVDEFIETKKKRVERAEKIEWSFVEKSVHDI